MDIFRNRFASIQDVGLVFGACAVPVHTWSTLTFFNQMPGWMVYLSTWDLIGAFAYTQAFAALESGMVLLAVILLGAILPARFLRDRFVVLGSVVVLLTLGWAVVARVTGRIPFTSHARWYSRTFLLGTVLYSGSIGLSYVLIHRHRRLAEAIYAFMERLAVLLYLYVLVAFLSIIIVVLRNLSGSI